MTKYVNADALKIQIACVYGSNPKYLRWLNNAPAEDVVPVRHAKWIPKITKIGGIDWPSGMICSGCGEDALNAEGTDFLTDFCPHCGARMDEGI
ncbi:MAG: hypothetical protein K6F23_03495 [Solobacterium sp.]|nr:hypothetical protein [Solobacterium sp.]